MNTSLLDHYGREAMAYVQASAKGYRGRVLAASKLPVTREDNSGDFLFVGD